MLEKKLKNKHQQNLSNEIIINLKICDVYYLFSISKL